MTTAEATKMTTAEPTPTVQNNNPHGHGRQQRKLAPSEITGYPGWRDPSMIVERSINSYDPTNHRNVHMGP